MISRFFIDRPIAANVIAWITILLGILSLMRLPVEQYPAISPPTVVVSTVYPGASASVVTDAVATPLEQQVNGVEGMLYMSSTCGSDGSYALTVTFDIGTDLDVAQILVQNRVTTAEPRLPEEVRRQGITVRKQSTNIVLASFLTSPEARYDALFLTNYANLHIRDELTRVAGVGEVAVRGTGEYSMRIWLDADRLLGRGLTVPEVAASLREQNVQVTAGQLGQPPAPSTQAFQVPLETQGRLSDVQQFENIVLKTGSDGRICRLKDVARVELGGQSYDQFTTRMGSPAAAILIFQLPGANSLDVAEGVRAAMEKMAQSFPPGLRYDIPFDTTRFVEAAIDEVWHTLIEAVFLVLLVILVFLHSWRAVLVPMTTVPVTLVGAFLFMQWFGFSVNLLTLFGLVLAIGIVVDDAIVIVENASHHIERGESPRNGTIRAMQEVLGPIIGITAVLLAVFLPTLFLAGITGQLNQQFALTIAATALISAINAVTLKPAQCATWLRPITRTNRFGRTFDRAFGWLQEEYRHVLTFLLRHLRLTLVTFVMLVAGTIALYVTTPKGFLPEEDQGFLIVNIQLPPGASLARTERVTRQLDQILEKTPGVDSWFVLGGFSFVDGVPSPSTGTAFVALKDWEERRSAETSIQAITGRLMGAFGAIEDAILFPIIPPSIRGLGIAGGFQMQLEDRGGVGPARLQQAAQSLIDAASRTPGLIGVTSTFRAGVPRYTVELDRHRLKRMGVDLGDVFFTLGATMGAAYVNDFTRFGRNYQVRMQADQEFRDSPDDVLKFRVKNRTNGLVPLSSVGRVEKTFGPQTLTRYNMYLTAAINGRAAPGTSSGEALETMEELAARVLPPEIGFEWTGMSFQEKQVGGQGVAIIGMSILLVYLVLAFLYESWLLPLAVILVVPLGILGSTIAIRMQGLDNNLYVQIGIVLIVALASKNAILIVEFARELREQGRTSLEAALEASLMRFRPILMTSFAFIFGVLPLVVAHGAAAASRRSLGTAVFGGMISGTVLAVLLVPALFVAVRELSGTGPRDRSPESEP